MKSATSFSSLGTHSLSDSGSNQIQAATEASKIAGASYTLFPIYWVGEKGSGATPIAVYF